LDRPRIIAEPCGHEVDVTIERRGAGTLVTLSEPVPTYAEQVQAGMVRVGDALREWANAARPALDAVGRQVQAVARAATELGQALDAEPPATRGAVASHMPTYRGDRPRHQSPYGPPQRGRRR
jgi:hypothetical protein